MENLIIVNNTSEDIRLVRNYIVEFAKTGVIHEDIIDIFDLVKIDNKVIVNFK